MSPSGLSLCDSHCHLDFLQDPDQAVAQALALGVKQLVVPAVSPDNFDRVRQLAHQHAGVFYALGLHPCSVEQLGDRALMDLENALALHRDDPKLVAVGEIGLDYFVQSSTEVQTRMHELFHAQLRLARDHDLPVLLHVRRAQDQVAAGLRRFGVRRGIAHAFNGSLQQAQAFLGLGMRLGFGGAMTFSRALQIRRLAQTLPLDALVLETDSPDIPPAWLAAGQENRPQELPRMAQALAELRGIDLEDLARATLENTQRALPRLIA